MFGASKSRIVIVSNRLPVSVVTKDGKNMLQRSVGGLATALSAVFDHYPSLWVGWPGSKTKLSKKQLAALDFPDRLLPITVPAKMLHHYYDRWANGSLWPLMHNIQPKEAYDETDWQAARDVTRMFATTIQKNLKPSDTIWIHDYHLLLLPQVLRERGITNRIGFFLHTPFPTPEVLLEWPEHRQLLRSLSQLDVLGFQTPRDVLNYRVALAAAGMSVKPASVVKAFPIGIDFKDYYKTGNSVKVAEHFKEIKEKIGRKKVILSVSRLDYTKGILEQLQAIEQLLEKYGPKRLLYKLIVAPSRESVEEYRRLKRAIQKKVNHINQRFSKDKLLPVEFTYRSHGFPELHAWYRRADTLLVTPKIDGMNLVAKEYIAVRAKRPGMLVISETMGAAAQLHHSLVVDPGHVPSIVGALERALSMPTKERKERWLELTANTKNEDIFWWTKNILAALHNKKSAKDD